MIDKLFGNVQAAPILTIGSGRPINPLTGFDASHSGAFPSSPRSLGLGPATPSLQQVRCNLLCVC
jgi:hypothetical protein